MQIEVGKTYLTRQGEKVTIEFRRDAADAARNYDLYFGACERGSWAWYAADGRWGHFMENTQFPYDLIAEAPPVEAAA